MAHNDEFDDSGALALTPPRVNIFAKPNARATAGQCASRHGASIFGPAAAWSPAKDERHDWPAPAQPQRARVRAHRAAVTRLVALSGLALVTALIVLRPAAPAPSEPLRPRAGHGETTLRARGEQSRDARRAVDAVRRPRTHKRARPHGALRHRARRARLQPRPTQRPAPPRAKAPPFATPRRWAPTTPVPTAPALPVPMRVPQSAPPEFM